MLDKKLARLKNELKDQEQRLSMYSKKNVKRREDRYTATKLALRKEKNKLSGLARKQADDLVKLRKELLEVKKKQRQIREEISTPENENCGAFGRKETSEQSTEVLHEKAWCEERRKRASNGR